VQFWIWQRYVLLQLGYEVQLVCTILVQLKPQLVLVQPAVHAPVLLQSGQALTFVFVAFQFNCLQDEVLVQEGYAEQFVQVWIVQLRPQETFEHVALQRPEL
jgi:hypothetical protein